MSDELVKRLRANAEVERFFIGEGMLYDEAADAIEELMRRCEQFQYMPLPAWIPVTARPMDEEERAEWSEKLGYDIEYEEALIFTSQLPDDGQEVLVCGRYGRIWIDKFENDPDYGCSFEENGDMDGITAWMPLPEPYKEERKDDETD